MTQRNRTNLQDSIDPALGASTRRVGTTMSAIIPMPDNHTVRTDRKYVLEVCARLKAFRIESGLAASDVAEHLKIPTALYVLYEDYELVPHLLIPALCKSLNLSPWHYLTGQSDWLSPPFRSNN